MTQTTSVENGDKRYANRGPTSADQPAGQAAFLTQYADFIRRVEQAKASLQQRYAEEYANYGNAISTAQKEVEEATQQAARRYAEQVKEAFGPSELGDRTAEAYGRFVQLLEQLGEGGYLLREAGRAYDRYLESFSRPAERGTGSYAGEAQEAYQGAVEKAFGLADTLKHATQAHAEYLVLLRQLQQERWHRLSDAYSVYVAGIQESPGATNFQARTHAAAETALTALQQAWQQTSEEYGQACTDAMKSMQELARTGDSSTQSR